MNTKWNDLSVKEKLAIITACLAFILGWAMTIAGFWMPPVGEVADSILWILGQSLIYTASVFGVSMYFKSEALRLKSDVDKHIEEMERLQLERMKIRQGFDVGEIPHEE